MRRGPGLLLQPPGPGRGVRRAARDRHPVAGGTSQVVRLTAVVALRPWAAGDLPLLERLLGDPAMTEHIGGPETLKGIRRRHARYLATNGAEPGRMFAIVEGAGGEAVGSVGFWERPWQGETVWETGWSVVAECQGQGIATRATAAAVALAEAEGIHRSIHAFPSIGNGASNAVCRKVGFTLLEECDFEYPPGHAMRCNHWAITWAK